MYGIPAGVSTTALLLVSGLFRLSMVRKKVEWGLIPLALALVGLTAYRLIQNCGYYFLPERVVLFWAGRDLPSWRRWHWPFI